METIQEYTVRDYIETQRLFVEKLNQTKYVHYRDLNKDIDRTNFQNCTKVDFKAVENTCDDIMETWDRLMDEKCDDYYFKSKTGSEYFIDSYDNVYRFSNHWGAVATCEWTREGEGQLMMSVFETGDWEIGIANLDDFKVFRRSVDRKKDMLLNPDWISQMAPIVGVGQLVHKLLKNNPEFDGLPNDFKMFLGKSYGFFKRCLSDLNLDISKI